MKTYFTGVLILLINAPLFAQNNVQIKVTDCSNGESLPGVVLTGNAIATPQVTDIDGVVVLPYSTNQLQIRLSYTGYQPLDTTVTVPSTGKLAICMHEQRDLEEVIVESIRSNKSLSESPTRVEVLNEEIEEAAMMEPSRISHLLSHSTGLQVQTTSASSGYANVRIQGLDGKYALVMKDGLPLYGGFSGNLSIIQIPPLDLKQVEFIKGPSSTLYGGGAISGLINLISKQPSPGQEFSLMMNRSHIGATDLNSFFSKRDNKIGLTVYSSFNMHSPYDPDNNGYSDVAGQQKTDINPKVFWYLNKTTTLMAGADVSWEKREGGDMLVLDDYEPTSSHYYLERNESRRLAPKLRFDATLPKDVHLTVKHGTNFFSRSLNTRLAPGAEAYLFQGNQLNTFSEVAVSRSWGKNDLTGGLNYYTDAFTETGKGTYFRRDYSRQVAGLFAQAGSKLTDKISMEAGWRSDYAPDFGLFSLPRVSALFKWNDRLSNRISGSLGYSLPTLFSTEAEMLGYRHVLPLSYSDVKAERSLGANADLTLLLPVGDKLLIRWNQLVFFNQITSPLLLQDTGSASGVFAYANLNGFYRTWGTETWLKIQAGLATVFIGYTYTDAFHFNGSVSDWTDRSWQTLTPRHSLKGDLVLELGENWFVGIDYEYKSSQRLSTGMETPSLLIFGTVIRYTHHNWSFFVNLENFTDTRQSRYDSVLAGPYGTPQFAEVWAPLDGFFVNGGFRLLLKETYSRNEK
jgi:iron complex outermembrane receptor protein